MPAHLANGDANRSELGMMTLDPTFFAFAVPAVLFAGISKGGFGAGAAFASTPFLSIVLGPSEAIGLMLPLLMLMDIGGLRAYWGRWRWPEARALIFGALPGIAAGAALYRIANADLLKFLIGGIAIGFVIFQLARNRGWVRPAKRPMKTGAGAAWGAAAGFTSFISHAGGPPAAIFLLSRQMDKTAFQATTVLVFWAINLAKFGPYILLGIFDRQTVTADLYLAPVALAGVWAGVVLHRRIPDRLFFSLVYVFLLATGAKLIWDALA